MDEYEFERVGFNDKMLDKGLEPLMKELLGNVLGNLLYDSLSASGKNEGRIEFEYGGENMTLTFFCPGTQVRDGILGFAADLGEEKRAIILEDSKYRIGFVEEKEVYTQISCNIQPARFGIGLETLMEDPTVISIEEIEGGFHSHLITRDVPDAKFESYRPATRLPIDDKKWKSDGYSAEALVHFNELGLTGSELVNVIIRHLEEFGVK